MTTLIHTGLAGLVLAFGVLIVWRPLSGWLDFWAHAAIGRWIWEHGRVPNQTLFLWTASEPWVYHSWLTQLIFFGLTNIGGSEQFPYVVLGFTVFMALLPFVLIAAVWRRCGRLAAWTTIPFILTLKGLALRFQTRPELFTGLLLCLLLVFLVAWSRSELPDRMRRRDQWGMAGLLLMFALWANLHGAVVIGWLILGVTAVCELAQTRFGRRSQWLAVLAALAPVAICVNPYFLGYWQTYRPVANGGFATSLQEWVPLWKLPYLPREMLVMLAVLVPLALVAWAMNPRRRWSHLAWLLLAGALLFSARRNIWPFALTALMVVAVNAHALDWESLWRRIARRLTSGDATPVRSGWRVVFQLVVLVWMMTELLVVVVDFRSWQPLVPARLEKGVVRFLLENKIEGRLFNDYENSSYLQWQLGGQPPLYIDLLNAYPDQVMRDYTKMVTLTDRGPQLFDEQQIGCVVLTTDRGGSPSLSRLAAFLDADARWSRVYAENDGVIWVRRTAQFEHLWGPRVGKVKATAFATFERWGASELLFLPAAR